MSITRRDFIATTALASAAAALPAQEQTRAGKKPIIVCAANGYNYLDDGYDILRRGGDTLDAAMRVVRGPEDDPNDQSVGLGGLSA